METPIPPPLSPAPATTAVPPPPPPPARPAAFGIGLKLFAIAFLVLALWIALQCIDGVRRERASYRDQAEAEVAQTWGGEQTIAGPFLVVPFTYPVRTSREILNAHGVPTRTDEVKTAKASAYFLPAELHVDGQIDPSLRRRGIFTVPVYETQLHLRGQFRVDPATIQVEGATFDWAHARAVWALQNPRGLRTAPTLLWQNTPVVLEPGAPREEWGETLESPVFVDAKAPGAPLVFDLTMDLRGSTRLAVAPVGAQTEIELASTWPDPSFGGASLPVSRTVSAEGFKAKWEQAYFGRGYPQQWSDAGQAAVSFSAIANSASEVRFLQPVDAYRLVERAIKYGVLFLVLVFANFFLFEVTARMRIHPLQYLIVGVALVLFFLGYLALSEFIAAGLAYAASAGISTTLVTGYSACVLKTGRRSLVVGGTLAATYGYLYFILQLQDYALLAGTAALFLLLGMAMWATRKIDWYGGK
ncbi:MAG TPA: cell envelope integrity protein CreD [Opitutaceae bacterium]|nr:cell envelope integrity protein CreD [Opitutaceae bacterium]HOR23695.1 cell envelope integrity protein CreD [Opitutaceae bacterium]HPK48554.1 cell envelope integrity protein CreD [Opitutaceae bacterium]